MDIVTEYEFNLVNPKTDSEKEFGKTPCVINTSDVVSTECENTSDYNTTECENTSDYNTNNRTQHHMGCIDSIMEQFIEADEHLSLRDMLEIVKEINSLRSDYKIYKNLTLGEYIAYYKMFAKHIHDITLLEVSDLLKNFEDFDLVTKMA
jgi:hypothetical protein